MAAPQGNMVAPQGDIAATPGNMAAPQGNMVAPQTNVVPSEFATTPQVSKTRKPSGLNYYRCSTSELRRFIHQRTGKWPLIQHGRRAYILQLRALDRNRSFPRFQDMPKELRDQVYGHLVLKKILVEGEMRRSMLAKYQSCPSLEILRASRAINREAEDVLHMKIPMDIGIVEMRLWTLNRQDGGLACVGEALLAPGPYKQICEKMKATGLRWWTKPGSDWFKTFRQPPVHQFQQFPLPEHLSKARHVRVRVVFTDVLLPTPPINVPAMPESTQLKALNRTMIKLVDKLAGCPDLKTVDIAKGSYGIRKFRPSVKDHEKILQAMAPALRLRSIKTWNRFTLFGRQVPRDTPGHEEYRPSSYLAADKSSSETRRLFQFFKSSNELTSESITSLLAEARSSARKIGSLVNGVLFMTTNVEGQLHEPVQSLKVCLDRARALGLLDEQKDGEIDAVGQERGA